MFLKNIISKIFPCFKVPEKEVAAFIFIPKNGNIGVKEILKWNKNSDRNLETILISEKLHNDFKFFGYKNRSIRSNEV